MTPVWDADGYPANLSAAVLDAQEWLHVFQKLSDVQALLCRFEDCSERFERLVTTLDYFISEEIKSG